MKKQRQASRLLIWGIVFLAVLIIAALFFMVSRPLISLAPATSAVPKIPATVLSQLEDSLRDKIAPVVDSIQINPNKDYFSAGEKVTLSVDARDAAGVKSVTAEVISPNSKKSKITFKLTGVVYSYTYTFPKLAGVYTFKFNVTDNDKNSNSSVSYQISVPMYKANCRALIKTTKQKSACVASDCPAGYIYSNCITSKSGSTNYYQENCSKDYSSSCSISPTCKSGETLLSKQPCLE